MEEKWKKVTAYIISRPGKEGRVNNPCGESTNKIILLCENLGYCNLHNVLRHGVRRERVTLIVCITEDFLQYIVGIDVEGTQVGIT